jgi:general secretion pathway protein G
MTKKLTRDTTRGFSLMELMVVITILGILAVIVQQNVWPMIGKGKQNAAKTQIEAFKQAVTRYRMNNSKLPDSLDLLVVPDPKNLGATYLEEEVLPLDPWENPYDYKKDGSSFEIISYGADGVQGGEGEDEDISSKTTKK